MSITKTGGSVQTSTTSNATSSTMSSTGNYLTELYISITQSGTIATVAATVQIQVTPDATPTWYSPPTLLFTAGLAIATYNWVALVPTSALSYSTIFTACTTGTSTCVIEYCCITGV
jgi:hypothetical protein